jgi:DNA polymerase-3 subunit delta
LVPEREVTAVAKSYIENKGYDIEPRPLQLLVENSGFKFSTIVKELDKVFSNVESGNKIREEQIEKYVGINKQYNIFALQKALAKKQKNQAVEIVNYFMANIHNHPIVMLNAALFTYFKKVAMVQSASNKTDKEVMSTIGIPFFAIGEYREAARNYSGKKIVDVIECINDCDLKFKGITQSSKDPKILFEETILKILGI